MNDDDLATTFYRQTTPRPATPPLPTSPDPVLGTVVANKYRLLGVIGIGGMSTVYRARDIGLVEREVAIKLLLPHLRQSAMIRVLREARIIATIQHPNIVQLLDAGRIEPDAIYIAMELLHGQNLQEILGEMYRRGEVFSWQRLAPMILQICEALRAVHQFGFVHRDMKPSNCFRTDLGDGRWHMKVLDFGISKILQAKTDDSSDEHATSTRENLFVGTPHYAAPEVIRGATEVDHRADIFAIGVMLYQCLTGSLPFPVADKLTVLFRTAHESPQPPSQRLPGRNISSSMDAVILRAMALDPRDRYPSIVELIDAIRQVDTTSAPPAELFPAVHGRPPAGPVPCDGGTTATALPPRQEDTRYLPALVAPPAPERRLTAILSFAARTARGFLGFLATRVSARRRRSRVERWRASDPSGSGTYHASHGPWLEIDALLSHHDFECTHEEARYIVSFLRDSFRRFRRVDKQTFQLDFDGSSSGSPLLKWEHYCIIITSEFRAPSPRLGTTFVERLVNIEPLLHAIRKNVRKTVIIITRSDRIGRGVYEKVIEYRAELDIYVIPILLANIIRAHKQRVGGPQSHLIQEFNRLHPAESRLTSEDPLVETAEVVGLNESIGRGTSHLLRNDPGILIVTGMLMSGRTSVVNSICSELDLGPPVVETLHAARRGRSGADPARPVHGARVAVIDDIHLRDMFSAALTERVRAHLECGRRLILTAVRAPPSWLEFIRGVAHHPAAVHAVAILPLCAGEFSNFARSQCVRRNIRLSQRSITALFRLSGGIVGFAASILNYAMRVALGTASQRRTLADMIDVLRPIEIGPPELLEGATALVHSTKLISRLEKYFSAPEIDVMQALAAGPLSAVQLMAKFPHAPSPAEVRAALLELSSLGLIKSTSRTWRGVKYHMTIGAFRHGIGGTVESRRDWEEPWTAPPPPAPAPPSAEASPETDAAVVAPASDLAATSSTSPGKTMERLLRTHPTAALATLLTSIFNDDELRAFLGELEGGGALLQRIPGPHVSFLAVVKQTADIMTRRGYIDYVFFQALASHVPKRRTDIEAIAQLWGFARTSVPAGGQDGTIFIDRHGSSADEQVLFISYAQDDWSDVQKIAGRFHRVGFRAVLDAWEGDEGGRPHGRLRTDFRRSLPGVVVLSPKSLGRAWSTSLLTTSSGSSGRLVPVLIHGVRPPRFLPPGLCVSIGDIERCEGALESVAQLLRG